MKPILTPLILSFLVGAVFATSPSEKITSRDEAVLIAAAVEHVASKVGKRESHFVVEHAIWSALAEYDRNRLFIIPDAPPFSFPAQKSSDRGRLYLRVGVRSADIDGDRAQAVISFYIGVEQSSLWNMRFRKTLGRWKVVAGEVIARS